MLDYRRLCRGREKLINEKMVFLVPRGSLCWYFFFFFLIATDIDIVFFPPPFPSLLPFALFCSRIYYPYSYYFASVRLI